MRIFGSAWVSVARGRTETATKTTKSWGAGGRGKRGCSEQRRDGGQARQKREHSKARAAGVGPGMRSQGPAASEGRGAKAIVTQTHHRCPRPSRLSLSSAATTHRTSWHTTHSPSLVVCVSLSSSSLFPSPLTLTSFFLPFLPSSTALRHFVLERVAMTSTAGQPQFRYTQPPSKVLHVRNLPWECSEEELIELCKPFGKVVNTKVNVGANHNQAFVEFVSSLPSPAALILIEFPFFFFFFVEAC